MKHCSKCLCEYEDSVNLCTQCAVPLKPGEITSEQRAIFQVQLNPATHRFWMHVQLAIWLVITFLLIVAGYHSIQYILSDGFFSQPEERMTATGCLLLFWFLVNESYRPRRKAYRGYMNHMATQAVRISIVSRYQGEIQTIRQCKTPAIDSAVYACQLSNADSSNRVWQRDGFGVHY